MVLMVQPIFEHSVQDANKSTRHETVDSVDVDAKRYLFLRFVIIR